MSTVVLTSPISLRAAPSDVPDAAADTELRTRLHAAEAKLAAVEAVRALQAETASFFSATEDHVRAAVFWTCEAELRAALRG